MSSFRQQAITDGWFGKPLIRRLRVMQAVSLLALVACVCVALWPAHAIHQEIDQLGKINAALHQLQGALDEQETGLQAYELTGVAGVLTPFHTGTRQFNAALQQLDALKIPVLLQTDLSSALQTAKNWRSVYALTMIQQKSARRSIPPVVQAAAKTAYSDVLKANAKAIAQMKALVATDDNEVRLLNLATVVLGLAIVMTVLALITAFIKRQLRNWSRSMVLLASAVERYAQGELHTPMPTVAGEPEWERLCLGVEAMRVALQNQLRSIESMALQDALTGVWNRRYFDRRLALEVRDANMNTAHQFCLLMCDIDYINAINDTFGYQEGDRVLKEVARQLQQNLRKGDILARVGGEEFAIITFTDLRYALDYAEQLRLASRFVTVQDQRVSISVGVSEYRRGEVPGAVLERVGEALYRAKQNGRNRVFYGA